jgi:TonB family protein
MRASVLVILRVTVNRNGSVADISYVSPGPGNYFARVAQRAALTWKFDPPLREGHAEPSVWRLRFFFSRRDVDVTASEEEPFAP